MSKLDELIAEMCPDGVQSKKISELCCISRGIVISKEDISNNVRLSSVFVANRK